MKKVLVTGGTGFVGKYLCKHLVDKGYKVWNTSQSISDKVTKSDSELFLELDITNKERVKSVFKQVMPDEVYHLAALTKPGLNEIHEFYNVNLFGSINILENSLMAGSRVILISSGYVYGSTYEGRISEEMQMKPINHYGISKSGADQLCKHYHLKGLHVVCARPFNHTGPGQSDSFLVPSIIKQCHTVSNDNKLITLGNVHTVRDFLDVRDVIKVYKKLITEGKSGDTYNVCSSEGITVLDIFNKVNKYFGGKIKLEIEETKKRKFDIPSLIGDNQKLIDCIGEFKTYSFERTLKDMINA